MSVRINTNVDAFEAQRNLGLVSMDFSRAVQQLSSGLRINSAADDAAGLAISQKLKTQITGFDQGGRNAQDGISMVQTAESALGTTESMLQRMRQLSVQAANDTYTTQDRQNIQAEINQLISEVDRIAQQTDFNTKKLLNGSAGAAQASGGGADIKGLVAQAAVAVATSFSVTGIRNATKSAVESSQAQGSFFTQQSSLTITGGQGTQTFTAQAGESLEDFFQVVNNAGIGVTMTADQRNARVLIANNNFGLNTGTGLVLTGPTAATVVDNGVTFPQGTVFTGGPEAVTVSGASGDFGTTGLCLQFNSASKGSLDASGVYLAGVDAVNAVVSIKSQGASAQVLTATGVNSDQISGAGVYAGLQITLSAPDGVVDANGTSPTPTVLGTIATTGQGGQDPFLNPNTNMLYVPESATGNLSVIDTKTNTLVATVGTGGTAVQAAANLNTNTIYVANATGHDVSVIDGATNTVTATITPNGGADAINGVAVNQATGDLYVADATNNDVYVYNSSNSLIATIATGGTALQRVAVDSTTNKVFVTDSGANKLFTIDGSTNTLAGSVSIANNPSGLAVNSATGKVWVGSNGTAVTEVDEASNTVTQTVTTGGSQPRYVAVDEASNRVFASNFASDTVSVIDGGTGTVTNTVAVTAGSGPNGLAYDPNNGYLYDANFSVHNVTVIDVPPPTDTATFTVTQNQALQFQVGANAQQTIAMAIDSANSQALGIGSLSVLTQPDAETAITQLDRAVQAVSANRAAIGALVNRLTNSMTNDQSAQENASASNSRIEDLNVAQATVQFTRDQILMQAGTSILAQANQSSSGILALLR